MVKNEVESVLKLAETLNKRIIGQRHDHGACGTACAQHDHGPSIRAPIGLCIEQALHVTKAIGVGPRQ